MPLRAQLRQHGVALVSLVPLRTEGERPPIVLTDPSVVIGSGSAAQIRLKSSSVSKAHAILLVEDGKAYVRDLASRTHLLVNDAAVRETLLVDGDVVRVGRFGFGVRENAAARARLHDPVIPTVHLRMNDTGAERVLSGRVILIGRRHGCDVIVPDHTLSGAHAVLYYVRGQWWVRDLGSREGTLVNGAEVRQQRPLSGGDLLKLGAAGIQFLGAAVATSGTGFEEPEVAGLTGAPPGIAEPLPVAGSSEPVNPTEAAPSPVSPGSTALNAPSAADESGAPIRAMQQASEPQRRAVEPVVSPVRPENGSARPSVFADAPIGAPAGEISPPPTPPPPTPPPASELPPHAATPPSATPGGNGWKDHPMSAGEPGDELAPPVYGNGDSIDDDDADEDSADDELEDGGSGSGALDTQPATEQEWDEAVTVWSFAELAQRGRGRSSRDETGVTRGPSAAERRRWLWVTVGAAIACIAVLVTLIAHKLW
jgi:pSer/pThr/pTyr-binding forkhead associated (FHA) protein